MRLKGYILAAVSAITYGLIPLFILPIKAINFPMETTLFYRFAISCLFVLVYLLFKKENFKLKLKELVITLILGLLYGLSADCLFIGYDLLTPGIASTILFVYPVFVAIMLWIFFKEKLSKSTFIAIAITLLGVFVLSMKDNSFKINLLGLGVSILSALCYATYMLIVNKSKIEISGIVVTFYSMLFTAIYYLCKAFYNDISIIAPTDILFDLTIFALVTTVLSITCLIYAIQLIGSTPTAIMGAIEPIVAVLISVILFNEKLTLSLSLGVIFIIIGVVLNIISDAKIAKRSTQIQT
jgi:drug/metabolite transporter (DMT)-like permease